MACASCYSVHNDLTFLGEASAVSRSCRGLPWQEAHPITCLVHANASARSGLCCNAALVNGEIGSVLVLFFRLLLKLPSAVLTKPVQLNIFPGALRHTSNNFPNTSPTNLPPPPQTPALALPTLPLHPLQVLQVSKAAALSWSSGGWQPGRRPRVACAAGQPGRQGFTVADRAMLFCRAIPVFNIFKWLCLS